MPEFSSSEWDAFIENYPEAHLLQTAAWGELKAAFGWNVTRVVETSGEGKPSAGAQILFRSLPLGFSIAYIAKGPLGEYPWKSLWLDVDQVCRKRHAVFLKVEPDLWEGSGQTEPLPGFRQSGHAIQPQRTLLVDLSGDEESVLGRMKQKTRYNIKLAQKKGVLIHASADIEAFHHMMQITGGRDGFAIHNLDYYRQAYELFHRRGACELLLAVFQGEPLAALMVFSQGRRSWYLYGASTNEQRDRMPTYLLQWEAMRWARSRGCTEYDLWGVPDVDESTLEASFTDRTDGLWGVYRHKRGYGGKLARAAGPWDRVYQPLLYWLYQQWVKRGG